METGVLHAGFTDAWIYRNNKTQGKNYYLRVKEKESHLCKITNTPDPVEHWFRDDCCIRS